MEDVKKRKGRCQRIVSALFCCMGLIAQLLLPAAAELIVDTESGESAAQLTATDTPVWAQTEEAVPTDATALDIRAKGAVLMELSSGQVLYEKTSHDKLPIASVTKIMTLLLVMEAIDEGLVSIDDRPACSAYAASMGGSQIWLEEGEVMSVHDLLKAAAVVSANDACAVLAEHVSGSVEGFVQRMNERAAELGMHDTRFLDCCGLNDEAYSSAYDVALMSRELMRHPRITQYTTIWMDTLRDGKSELVNTNKLVRHYQGATGLKTGTTGAAKHCLSATAERDGMGLVAVVLGCDTTNDRFGGARKLLDFGFANYSVYTPEMTESIPPVPVLHGLETTAETVMDAPESMLLRKGQEAKVSCHMTLADNVEAPVLEGQVLGEMTVKLEDETLVTYAIRARREVGRLTTRAAFGWLWQALCGVF